MNEKGKKMKNTFDENYNAIIAVSNNKDQKIRYFKINSGVRKYRYYGYSYKDEYSYNGYQLINCTKTGKEFKKTIKLKVDLIEKLILTRKPVFVESTYEKYWYNDNLKNVVYTYKFIAFDNKGTTKQKAVLKKEICNLETDLDHAKAQLRYYNNAVKNITKKLDELKAQLNK